MKKSYILSVLIFALTLLMSLSAFAGTQIQIYIDHYALLLADTSFRTDGIRLDIWKINKEDDVLSQVKYFNEYTKEQLNASFGEPIRTAYSNTDGMILQVLEEGERYYVREYIEGDHRYDLNPIIFDATTDKIFMKSYTKNGETPPDVTPPTPPTSNKPKVPDSPESGDFHFMKIGNDINKTPLEGAVFKITRLVDGKYETVLRDGIEYVLTSDKNGIFAATNLPYGSYYLWEIKPPEGYKALSEPIRFDITSKSNDGKVIVIENIPFQKIDIPKTGDITLLIIICFGILSYILGSMILNQSEESVASQD